MTDRDYPPLSRESRELRKDLQGEGSPSRRNLAALQAYCEHPDVSFASKCSEAAYMLFRLRLGAGVTPGERAAIILAALQLVEGKLQAKWVGGLRAELDSLRRQGIMPNWAVLGLGADDATPLFDKVREIRKLPPLPIDDQVNEDELGLPLLPDSAIRVCRVRLSSFRSIPGDMDVGVVDTSGRPVSLLVSGDNGTGKSSLVSGLEFALQGTVGRSAPSDPSSNARPVNLNSGEDVARAEAMLSDGSVSERSCTLDGRVDGTARRPEFSMTPISLQRADIIRFLQTSANTRGQLFVGTLGADSSDPKVRDAEELLKQARARKALAESEVARQVSLPDVPGLQFRDRVARHFLDGLTLRQWREAGRPFPAKFLEIDGRLAAAEAEAKAAKARLSKLIEASRRNHPAQIKRLRTMVGDLSEPLTKALKSIVDYDHVDALSVEIGKRAVDLSITVVLKDGGQSEPEKLFSEGVQDLIAILFFLEIAHAASKHGQAKVMILDDVIQSVDAGIRTRLMEHIASRFHDWQLFVTCHDKLWREQMRSVLRRANHPFTEVEFRSWSYETGPRLIESSAGDLSAPLRAMVGVGSASAVAGQAGRLLEAICDRLSWTLPVAVQRRRDDRYDLGALWPPLQKKLKRSNVIDRLRAVDGSMVLRNLLGAHYNEFAESIADSEADEFAGAVLALWESVFCDSCGQWVERSAPGEAACRCKKTQVIWDAKD